MTLYLNTTQINCITVRLFKDHKMVCGSETDNKYGSQVLLTEIYDCIANTRKVVSDVTQVVVEENAGSYTGTRVGVAVANALAYALQIPVNGKNPPEEMVEPLYAM